LLQAEGVSRDLRDCTSVFPWGSLNQSSMIIHDAYKTYYLNEANEIEEEYPSGKLLAEPIRNQDGQFSYLSELEKNSDNVGYFDAASCYEAYCNDDELMNGAYGYYGG
jgi:hypothetical protein